MTKKQLLDLLSDGEASDDAEKIIKNIENLLYSYADDFQLGDFSSVNEFQDQGGLRCSRIGEKRSDSDIVRDLNCIESEVKTFIHKPQQKKNFIVSVLSGVGAGILFLAVGLILVFCVPAFEGRKDELFFTLESIKDILAALGTGTVVYGRLEEKQNREKNSRFFIVQICILALMAFGAGLVMVIACFTSLFVWNRWICVLLEISFMVIALVFAVCIIFGRVNNHEQER